jgi:hypothetical protein
LFQLLKIINFKWEPDEDDAQAVARKLSRLSPEEQQAKVNEFLSKLGHGRHER